MQQMQVMCRVRPLSSREQQALLNETHLEIDAANHAIELHTDARTREKFTLDGLFWQNEATQSEIYSKTGRRAADAAFEGFNSCVFAYGQTGSGKTFTMMGTDDAPGIIPHFVGDVFDRKAALEQQEQTVRITISCSFFEIYNEKVRDLLVTRNTRVSNDVTYAAPRVRQHPTRGVFVEGLECIEAQNAADVMKMIKKGVLERATSSTNSNSTSSRSHAIFQLVLRFDEGVGKTTRISTASLVDLAGSERVNRTGATGATLEELKRINSSLTTLKRVLEALDPKNRAAKTVVPYRDSVLTHVLSEALNGNSYTLMLAMISPAPDDYEDTVNTLRFAAQARRIVLQPKMNQRKKSMAVTNAMKDEIEQLRQQLSVASVEQTELREELEGTLQSRQEELALLVASQQSLEDRVKAYEERERLMSTQMKAVSAERDLFKIAISEQKRQRFAAAFRNAFRLSRAPQTTTSASTEQAPPPPVDTMASSTNRRVTIFQPSAEATDDGDYYPQRVVYLEEQLELLQRECSDAQTRVANLEEQNRALTSALSHLVARGGWGRESNHSDVEPRLFSPSKGYAFRNASCVSQSPPPPLGFVDASMRTETPSPIVDVSRSEPDGLSATLKPDDGPVGRALPPPSLSATSDPPPRVDDANLVRILHLESRCDALMTELWHAERALETARQDLDQQTLPAPVEPSPAPMRTPSVVPPLKINSRSVPDRPEFVTAWRRHADPARSVSYGHHRRSVSTAAYHSDTLRVL